MDTIQIKSKTIEIDVPEKNPFFYDMLDREKTGMILTDIVSFYGQSGCVMAITGEWGSGKTTFIRMWSQMLKNMKFKTLYFNAWSSDYTTDPLMAMISELKELSPESNEINKIADYAGRIALSVAKGFIRKATGIECDDLTNNESLGEKYLKKFDEQKACILNLKSSLKEYVADNAGNKPVVFFVDELDRCNPHYAVAVLERIKHLFDIPNIIFILAINKKELCNAIQGYYGSTNINSNEYLRRFIDIEYQLPTPKLENYCQFLYQEYNFNEFFGTYIREQYFSDYCESESFNTMAIKLCEATHTNLRQLERIYAHARLSLMQFAANSYLIPSLYFLLCFWKITKPEFYMKIRHKEYSTQGVLSEIEKTLPHSLLVTDKDHYKNRDTYELVAGFIYGYDITALNAPPRKPALEFTKDETTGENKFKIATTVMDKDMLNEVLDYFYTNPPQNHRYGLKHIFNRIDLLDKFQV